jgi:protein gp37
MGIGTSIEWTEATWNPVTGCTKISPGCKHCYAERMSKRLQAMGQPNYALGFEVALHERMLDAPLRWKKPQSIFVNSMSDLFHAEVPVEFIQRVFGVMRLANWHRYQVLTKRADRLLELSREIDWPDHVWMGVSVESREYLTRVERLRQTGARVKFLSVEPLLEDLGEFDLSGIDWVIAGGESGPGARPMDPAWVRTLRDHCAANGVRFFFKQWGGTRKKAAGRVLDGRTWDELPIVA